MSVRIALSFVAVCDGCMAHSQPATSEQGALRAASWGDKWKKVEGLFLCVRCQQTLEAAQKMVSEPVLRERLGAALREANTRFGAKRPAY